MYVVLMQFKNPHSKFLEIRLKSNQKKKNHNFPLPAFLLPEQQQPIV